MLSHSTPQPEEDQRPEEEKPASFFTGTFKLNEIGDTREIYPIPRTPYFATRGGEKMNFWSCQNGNITFHCSIEIKGYYTRGICINPQGLLVIGADLESARFLEETITSFFYYDISAGLDKAKLIDDFVQHRNIKKNCQVLDWLIPLEDGGLVCTDDDESNVAYLDKNGNCELFDVSADVTWMMPISEKWIMVVVGEQDIELINVEDFYNHRKDLPNKKVISGKELGFEAMAIAFRLHSGEIAIMAQPLGTPKFANVYNIYLCTFDQMTLTPIREIVTGLSTTDWQFPVMQTPDDSLLFLTESGIRVSQYDVTFQGDKNIVEKELRNCLTKDTTGVVMSYLHTRSFFKPAVLPDTKNVARAQPGVSQDESLGCAPKV